MRVAFGKEVGLRIVSLGHRSEARLLATVVSEPYSMMTTSGGLQSSRFQAMYQNGRLVRAYGAWLMHFALISLSLIAATATPLNEPVLGRIIATAPQTCAVLQAAYTAASRHETLIYPRDVRSETRAMDLGKWVPEYRAKLALSAREFDELLGLEIQYRVPAFKPVCTWQGNPGPSVDDEGHATFVTFTSPIFSNSGQLAIVEVSFREEGIFGYGMICVVRQRHGGWDSQCQNSWIS